MAERGADEMRLRVRVPGDSRLAAFLAPIPPRDRGTAVLALAEAAAGQGFGDMANALRALAAALARIGGVTPAAPAPADAPAPQAPAPQDPEAPVSPRAAARVARFEAAGGWG